MTTAVQMITRSMRLIGALGSEETASAAEGADGLAALNTMLDSWSIRRLYVHQIQQLGPLTLISSQASYTIGSSGNFNVARPSRITHAFVRDVSSGVDTPVEVTMDRSVYNRKSYKATTSPYPNILYYETAMPLGRIWLYPTPDTANTLYLDCYTPLSSFAGLATDVTLPPGYRRAIEYGLAVEIAPEYGKSISQEFVKSAGDAVAAIKSLNAVVPTLSCAMFERKSNNILTDGE
jgi:hypothetical protein